MAQYNDDLGPSRDLIDKYTFYFEIPERFLDGLLDLWCVCICQGKPAIIAVPAPSLIHSVRERHIGADRYLLCTMGPHRINLRQALQDDHSSPALR